MTNLQKLLIAGALMVVVFILGWRVGHGTKRASASPEVRNASNSGKHGLPDSGRSGESTSESRAKPAEADAGYNLSAVSGLPWFQRTVDFAAFLESASASEIGGIYASLAEAERWGRDVELEFGLFLAWAAQTDPHAALALIHADGLELRFGEPFFKAWATSAPGTVLAELEKSAIDRERWGVAIYGVTSALGDPNAQRVAELLGPGFARQIAMEDANALIRREGIGASVSSIVPKLEALANASSISLSHEMAPFWMAARLSTPAIRELIDETMRSNPVLAKADRMTSMWAGPLVGELAKRDPRETMTWLLNSEHADQLTPMINDAMKAWAKADIDESLEFIRSTPMAPQRQIKLLLGIVNSGGAGDPALVEDAWKLIHELKGKNESN